VANRAATVFVAGGTGFIGSRLTRYLLRSGFRLTVTGTRPQDQRLLPDGYTYLQADTTRSGDWQNALARSDIVVNLAGKTISSRWTRKEKKAISESRLLTTRRLVEGLDGKRASVLCSASAVGYYGAAGDRPLSETSPSGDGFLAELGRDWESEALKAADKGLRVILGRFGVVLGPDGGALSKMLPIYKWWLGGPLGNGRQWFPWVHIDDLLSAILYTIQRETIEGPVNMCSPNPVRNRDLAKALGSAMGRPSLLTTPSPIVRLVLGEFGSSLVTGQRVLPKVLMSSGFSFRYPDIHTALSDIIGKM